MVQGACTDARRHDQDGQPAAPRAQVLAQHLHLRAGDALGALGVIPALEHRGASEVHELRFGHEPGAPAALRGLPEEIEVLGVHEVALGEPAHISPQVRADRQHRADRGLDRP